MNRKSLFAAAAVASSLFVLAAAAQATAMTEVEPNDTLDTGQKVGPHDGTLLVTGFRADSNDDFFRFQATAGDVISLTTIDLGGGTFYDPTLALFDPLGNLFASDDNSGVDGLSPFISGFSIGSSGLFGVRVSGAFSTDTFNYRLDIRGLTPTASVPEPGTLALLGLGLAGLGLSRRRKAD